MILLLCGSAFFSGAETAFFNLSRRQITLFKKSDHRLQNLAARLLKNPGKLLSCFLFGNMTVNILFYAAGSMITIRIDRAFNSTAAVITAALIFIILLLFGEILPKSLAYANSRSISIATALPSFLCLKILSPIVAGFQLLLTEPILRLLLGAKKESKPITTDEFKTLIGAGQKSGSITDDENKLLSEIIELGFLKVRDCLWPRVDMIACDVTQPSKTARDIMQKNNLTKLPVYVKTIDNIVGLVQFRHLLLEPDKPLDKLVQQVNFVPEQKTIESLLEFFRKTHTDTAIVVDEYGGIAGSICLEDIAEELLGPIELAEMEPIEQTGPFTYRLTGNLAIHEWAQAFDITASKARFTTIAGLVTANLGKVPKAGDTVHIKNIKFTVEKMQKHRIETLILTFEPTQTNDN